MSQMPMKFDSASLAARDYTLIIDKSGSMSTVERAGGQTRWEAVQESALALARKCEEFDADGMTVYVFSSRFKRYDNVTSSDIERIFQENKPSGGTNLVAVLQDAINNYFQRKATGKTKPLGEIFLVVSDGEPDDRIAVSEVILNVTRKMDRDEELGISLIQVGCDPGVAKYLKSLDDLLQGLGAKFDIVDTVSFDEMENLTLTEVLMNAIAD
ncbi:MAG: VWA domain-containing protein [Hydrococcus sp. C42_A2020_068]|nr:VWA domain-containing protein [Hydrococcus sp. C42_A2020_068]